MDYQIVAVSVPIGKLKDLSEWYKKYNKVRYSVEKEWQTMPFILETKESRSDIMLARKKYEIRGIQIEVVEKPRCKNPRYGMWVNDALFQMGNIALNQEEKFIQYAEDIKNEPIQCVTEGCNDFVSFGSPDNGTECPKCGRGILYISSCPKT
ncbi:MAG: hypothetical protein D3913_14030 [Candidatus Electrothrix sp. LOE1_4_5]|nr:hypothetical protein [Candidatus Electrothrix gigas]MCI5127498.1 hypothetical protein [Candidatus Electrothrix gigas]